MQKNVKTLLFGAATAALLSGSGIAQDDAATEEAKIDFATQIYPFMKSGCVKCHLPSYEDERGRTRRPKAELILTTKEGILAGGETQQAGELGIGDATGGVVPGAPDKSEFLIRVHLPIDDDAHQPPEGKAPQWTEAEKDLFEKWIAQGADFGDWTEDPAPQEGLEWDGVEKEPGTLETASPVS